jgi:hypothetical protein
MRAKTLHRRGTTAKMRAKTLQIFMISKGEKREYAEARPSQKAKQAKSDKKKYKETAKRGKKQKVPKTRMPKESGNEGQWNQTLMMNHASTINLMDSVWKIACVSHMIFPTYQPYTFFQPLLPIF